MEGYKLINNELKKFSGSTYVDSELSTVSENPVQNKIITKEINNLKKSVSDGKTLVATAITDKGVETAADATFAVMADNISQIETGSGELHGATISITTSEENPTTITVSLTKDSTTIEQKNFDSNGLCTFTDIQESGDYTITASNEDISNSTTVTITSDNIVNKTVTSVTIEFTLDGSTATPLNDVSIWLRTDSTGSSLNAGWTTLEEVIADTTTLSSLMADESAMNYLARSTGFADEACASETFMTYLGASPYVDDTVLNSELWLIKIYDSNYMTKIIKGLLPTMTSNTCDVGTITLSCNSFSNAVANYLSSSEGYILTTDANREWFPSEATNYITFAFINRVNVLGFSWNGRCLHATNGAAGTVPINIYGRNSSSESWNLITTVDSIGHAFNNKQGIGFLKKNTYLQYKLESKCPSGYSYRNIFMKLQIYGY